MWIIERRNNSGPLLFKFDNFLTECSWDHVYIFDGNGVYGEQLAAFRYFLDFPLKIVCVGNPQGFNVARLSLASECTHTDFSLNV